MANEARRFNVVDCGRRWGKTTLGENKAVEPLLAGWPVGWFAPAYKYATEVWRDLSRILHPIIKARNTAEMRMELVTGGVLEVWTLTNQDAGRSRKYKRVIVDEAALVPKLMETWNSSIRPALIDYTGDAFFLSTPKGHNGFWKMYQWGKDGGEWACWQMPTDVNPYIPNDEIDAMRATLPERVFAQEVLAKFLDDAGGVFRKVVDAATGEEQPPRDDAQYIFGVDWGKSDDFTVITVLDITTKTLVKMERFNQIDYAVQVGRLQALYEQYKPVVIIAEANAMGEPIIEQLWRLGLPVNPFTTTNATKAVIIEGLALAFERGDITILNDQTLINELQAYEMTRLPSGLFRYGAPDGVHDDTVMSLALAQHGGSGGLVVV